MNTKTMGLATIVCAIASAAFAAPSIDVTPGGIQSNNWIWNVGFTPDLSLVPDNSGTPIAVEFGFRLTGAPLISAMNINPSEFDTPNPGAPIFGWEIPDPTANNKPAGLQVNTSTGEIFASYGSADFTTPGSKPFLQIVTGPVSDPGGLFSTIQWLGAYGSGANQGIIAQVNGLNGTTYVTGNYYFGGTATQAVPEPTSIGLIGIGAILISRRRRVRGA
jgi:hypothetical protein